MQQLQLPPWMVYDKTPGEHLLQGAQVGSNLRRNFLLARQQAEESAREQAMMPLRMAQAENQLKAQRLDLEVGMIQQQDSLLNKRAFADLAGAAAEISANAAWANPESEKRVWEIAASNPSVVASPVFQNIVKQFDAAGAAAIRAREAETRAMNATANLELGKERNAIAAEKNSLLDEKYKAELASKEKLAGEKNVKDIEVARLKMEAKARDVLPDALYRQFSELAGSIAESSEFKTLADKESAMNKAFDRLKEKVGSMKEEKGGGTNEVIRSTRDGRKAIFDGNTKKFLRYAE